MHCTKLKRLLLTILSASSFILLFPRYVEAEFKRSFKSNGEDRILFTFNCLFSPFPFSPPSLLFKKPLAHCTANTQTMQLCTFFCQKDSFYLHVTGIQTNRIMAIVATCVTWAAIQHVGIPSTTALQRVCSVVFFTREML